MRLIEVADSYLKNGEWNFYALTLIRRENHMNKKKKIRKKIGLQIIIIMKKKKMYAIDVYESA